MKPISKEYRQAFDALRLLTPEQRDALFDSFYETSYSDSTVPQDPVMEWNSALDKFFTDRRFANGRVCAHCNKETGVVRCGHTKAGSQRYRCNECGKTFTITSNTALQGVKKNLRTIKRFIFSMVNGWSLDHTAAYCKIHRNTAYRWRHKILDAVQKTMDNVVLNGIVEADGTYFKESFKGNHDNDGFVMPRPAHKRGKKIPFNLAKEEREKLENPWKYQSRRGISGDKICVVCAINREGVALSRTVAKGRPTADSVESALSGTVAPGSHFCTDRHTSYLKYAKCANLDHKRVNGTKGSLYGIYHIQHVNQFHEQLESFVNKTLHGVSTKHLHKYLAWNVFLSSSKTSYEEKERLLGNIIANSTGVVRCADIANLPATL